MDLVTIAALLSFGLLIAAWLRLPASADMVVEPIENAPARPQLVPVEAVGEERAS